MTATFHVGDAIEVMSKLPEKSVDLVLTSPPFLALRSYLPADHPDKALEGGSQATPGVYIDWLVDVVEACDRVLAPHGSLCIELGDTYAGSGGGGGDYLEGGWREGQAQFAGSAASMKESNAAHWRQKNPPKTRSNRGGPKNTVQHVMNEGGSGWPLAKSLSLIPELFRLTLVYGTNPLTGRTTDRWRLRNVVRWVRPNPPVGALGDKFRPATSELMVFCKSAKRYFDLDSVRNPNSDMTVSKGSAKNRSYSNSHHGWAAHDTNDEIVLNPAGAPPLDWWNIPLLEACEHGQLEPHPIPSADDPRLADPVGCLGPVSGEPTRYGPKVKDRSQELSGGQKREKARKEVGLSSGSNMDKGIAWNQAGAPPLDWWNIPPGGFSGAHYAVWPPELLIKPIKAMCPEKVCRVCGEPSRRITEVSYTPIGGGQRPGGYAQGAEEQRSPTGHYGEGYTNSPDAMRLGAATRSFETTGWSDCGHDDWRPGLVLDPFGGSGTTALVATGHGRDCILIDLDARNVSLARDRIGPLIFEESHVGETSRSDTPLLAEGGTTK